MGNLTFEAESLAQPHERLAHIAEQLKEGEAATPVTVRTFLGWFNAQRRGYWITALIRRHLDVVGLETNPDFEGAYLDSEIQFQLSSSEGRTTGKSDEPGQSGTKSPSEDELSEPVTALAPLTGGVADPTYRIGKLAAANNKPVAVTPETELQEATTLMMLYDYSQVPVMQSERTVKGMVTWQSIGSRLALGRGAGKVVDFMTKAVELSADVSLFAAISVIVEHEAVLIRGADQRVTGIVTTSDLSLQFRQLAEPFLLLGEIENHVRRLIDGRFTAEEAKAAYNGRSVESVADLTFGAYGRLLEDPKQWSKLNLNVDRAAFVKQLDRVREIRNNVMHFDPDGVTEDELTTLRKFVLFLQTLQLIGIP